MLKLPPRSQPKAPHVKGSGDDNKNPNSNDPPKHARLAFAQTIAETTDSFDSVASLAQLLAQPADVSIDGAGIDHAFITPDVAQQAAAPSEAVMTLNPAARLKARTSISTTSASSSTTRIFFPGAVFTTANSSTQEPVEKRGCWHQQIPRPDCSPTTTAYV